MKSGLNPVYFLIFTLVGYLPHLTHADVQAQQVVQQAFPREFLLDGTVEAIHRSTISAQTSGQVEAVLFDVDDYVEQGEVLIRLKETEQKARLRQAEADLKAAIARLQEAEDEYTRFKGMHEKKLISQSQMDKATAALKSARAGQDAASAGLIQASEQFEYTRIKAPYSGIVTERHVQVGEVAAPGQPLISGISLDQLRVLVDVPQSLIQTIREQRQARVLLNGEAIEAVKLTIFPYAHAGSNTFKVRIDLPQGVPGLFPGMFVKTAFVTGVKKELVVPRSAVVYRSEVTAVYVVGKAGRISFRRIRAGSPIDNEKIAVIAGLSAGERVALDPIAAGAELKRQMAEADHE
ncbi:MAG: efflux RND transporter periplasmic adaptor subunit [Gammaproteobacteria bacterium]|nr:efflux RND transporter periplasmic adaptor subunit [Gammaproteobacteria bacterium]